MTATTSEPVMGYEQGTDDLLKKAFALTHKMHALDKTKVGIKDKAQRTEIEDAVADLRSDRDIITREILRRTGEL